MEIGDFEFNKPYHFTRNDVDQSFIYIAMRINGNTTIHTIRQFYTQSVDFPNIFQQINEDSSWAVIGLFFGSWSSCGIISDDIFNDIYVKNGSLINS